MKVKSSVLSSIELDEKKNQKLLVTFKHGACYSYDCGTPQRAKTWMRKIVDADSAGTEFSKFKKLGLKYKIVE